MSEATVTPIVQGDGELTELQQRLEEIHAASRRDAEKTGAVVSELSSRIMAKLHEQRQRATIPDPQVGRTLDLQEQLLTELQTAQAQLRDAQAAERQVRDAVDETVREAEDELAEQFTVRGNKTYLAVDADGARIAEDDQRSFTADEKKAWIAAEARKRPAVAGAITTHRQAELDVQLARDAKEAVITRLSAINHELDARVALLNAITAGVYVPAWKEQS